MERQSCYEIGIVERENHVLARDLLIERDGKRYVISVGIPRYRTELENHRINEGLTPPNEHEILIIDDVTSVEEICQSLSAMPFETLQPYLTEQDLSSSK